MQTLPEKDPPKHPMKSKLSRRTALALVIGAAVFAPLNAVATTPKGEVNIDLDSIRGFRINYKGKEHAFTTDEVYDALLGEGRFGD